MIQLFRMQVYGSLLFLFFECMLHSVHAGPESGSIIRNIKIIRQNVFPEINSKPEFLYKLANKLHVVTKEDIIQDDLLFDDGDKFDPDLLEESERKLRRHPYFGEVKIVAHPVAADSVDIEVVTQDQWSTLTSAIIEGGGGRTTLGGALEEFNLLGYGKKVFAEVKHEPEGIGFTFQAADPQLFGSRWTTSGTYSSNPFNEIYSVQLARPFFSLDTKWAGGFSFSNSNQTIRLFTNSAEVSRLDFQSKSFQTFGSKAWGERYKKTRLQIAYTFQERDFSEIAGQTFTTVPEDELIHRMTASLRFEGLAFVEDKRIDNFVVTEDITLGNITQISLGRTGLPFPAGVRRFELRLTQSQAHKIFGKQYVFGGVGFRTLFDKDTISSLSLRYYNKMFPFQTLAMNFRMDYASNLEESTQFLLGGDSGLRGFEARAFTGARRMIVNIENRVFTNLNILTVALGGVAFFDTGNVWKEGETLNLSQLNSSVGLGLRLGYTKSPNSRVGRIDFGFPLNRKGFEISIGIGQQFSLN